MSTAANRTITRQPAPPPDETRKLVGSWAQLEKIIETGAEVFVLLPKQPLSSYGRVLRPIPKELSRRGMTLVVLQDGQLRRRKIPPGVFGTGDPANPLGPRLYIWVPKPEDIPELIRTGALPKALLAPLK